MSPPSGWHAAFWWGLQDKAGRNGAASFEEELGDYSFLEVVNAD
jgi:hypothetical protein